MSHGISHFLTLIPSRSIHTEANGKFHSFLWLSNVSLYVCVCVFFFIHSSIDRNLGYFHILAIVTNSVMNRRCAYMFLNEYFHFL